ncbi:polysaccharide deacetylase family protein [Enterococcus sp. DIV0876]|uniref:polysaccharide deacetylase family protein n=1 Tax=Enterococcus sp. DIV0876 TaxID=2774633 RepID=UPI003D2FFB2E
MFRTLVFHEIRPEQELLDHPRPIAVADGYQDAMPLPLFNSTSHFKQQLAFLKAENYHTLTLDEVKAYLFAQQPIPEKSVLLTFDDCYQSMKEYAYPLLKEAGFHASVFVVTGWLFDQPRPYDPDYSQTLSQTELLAMTDVFEYANHTHHFHERKGLKSRSMWEKPTDFATDLARCNQWVTIKDVFAYPFGFYDQGTINTLKEANFKLAFTTKPGCNTATTPPMELHRDVIPFNMPLAAFKELLTK